MCKPQELSKRLPRYPSVPVARVGRLAVDQTFHGKKPAAAFLADTAMRAARSELAVFALVVDAKDPRAQAFYRHHGFEAFGSKPMQMILSLKHFARQAG